MYTSIVVPLDGSAFAKRALPVALALAHRSDAAVHLVHVHEPILRTETGPQRDAQERYARRETWRAELTELARRLGEESRLRVDVEFLEGPVLPTLQGYLSQGTHDLVVMMTHGRGGLTGAWLGSIADGLVRHAPVPLLLVRPGAEWPSEAIEPLFCHVLVPLDGSTESDEVLDHAVALNTPDATIYTLLTVVVPLPLLGQEGTPCEAVTKRAFREHDTHAAQLHLNAMAKELRESGALVETRVVVNRRPAQGILNTADEQHVDSIALATQGLGASSRLLLGSVADEVIRGARVPVLIFRPARARAPTPAALAAAPDAQHAH